MLPALEKLAAGEAKRPRWELADVFREYGEAYRQAHSLPLFDLQVRHAIEVCRTEALGGHLDRYSRCGHPAISYNSCLMGSTSLWGVQRERCFVSLADHMFLLPIK
jgi:Transposase zinc-binding domain